MTDTTLMLIATVGCIVMVVMGIVAEWRLRSSRLSEMEKNKELWKTLALALEAWNDARIEYEEEDKNEGCMKRSRRREQLGKQLDNAYWAAAEARNALVTANEYV